MTDSRNAVSNIVHQILSGHVRLMVLDGSRASQWPNVLTAAALAPGLFSAWRARRDRARLGSGPRPEFGRADPQGPGPGPSNGGEMATKGPCRAAVVRIMV